MTTTGLKILSLIFMTIDHIGEFIPDMVSVDRANVCANILLLRRRGNMSFARQKAVSEKDVENEPLHGAYRSCSAAAR